MKKKRIKKNTKMKGFSIQFLPYSEIKELDSNARIKKILDIIMKNNLLLLQGRLRLEEETKLIGDTMTMISKDLKDFKGVELAVISNNENTNLFARIKRNLVKVLSGGDLGTITIIGPATIVKEIKKNPKKIELLLKG